MRRPLLIVFIFIIIVSFIYTMKENVSDLYRNENIEIEGVVKNKKEKEKYDEYYIEKFIVRDYSKNKRINIGSTVKVRGKYKNLQDMKYDDFDYGKYIKSIGMNGLIYIDSYDIIGENYIYKNIYNFKKYINETYKYLYKEKSDFINSLILGEKDQLSAEDKEIFKRTGTSHIIAISGLHIGILCTIVAFIVGGINKVYKLVALTIVLFFYNIMIGPSPSIIRSILFSITIYISIFIDRRKDGISTLSLIGIFLLINNPYIIYNVSFQLSFLATLSIIYFYGHIKKSIKFSVLAITLSANILTIPIIYYNFKSISTITILSNLIIVPFIGVIMYLSITSILVFNINIMIAKLIASFNSVIINIIYSLLEKLSNLYFAYIEVDNPNIYYVIIYYIVVFSYMIYKEMTVMKEQKNELQGYYK